MSLQEAFQDRVSIVEWLRGGRPHREPGRKALVQAGDVFVVRASPDEMASIDKEPGLALHAVAKYGDCRSRRKPRTPTTSRTSCRSSWLRARASSAERSAVSIFCGRSAWWSWVSGAVLAGSAKSCHKCACAKATCCVLWGTPSKFSQLADDHGFLMMVPFEARARRRHRAAIAVAIIVAVVAAAASGMVACADRVPGGCGRDGCDGLRRHRAGVSRDRRAHLRDDRRRHPARPGNGEDGNRRAVREPLAERYGRMGRACRADGALLGGGVADADSLGRRRRSCCSGPISLALAVALGLPPEPFVVCTALGAVVAFLTPIGHHGNLLILNPGQYTFGDFLRVGVPLTHFHQRRQRVAGALVVAGRRWNCCASHFATRGRGESLARRRYQRVRAAAS